MILPLPVDLFTFFIHSSVFVAFGALALVAHEIGHYATIKHYGGKPKISYYKGDLVVSGFNFLNKEEKISVYYSGVILGLLMLVPAMFLLFPPLSVGLIAAYLVGCKHDFKELMRLIK